MNINRLIKFLTSNKEQEDFLISIKNEVRAYVASMHKNGHASNVYITGNFEGVIFTDICFISLLTLYMDGKLLEWDLDYVTNGIELCDIECEDKTQQLLPILASSDINMKINRDNIHACLSYLKGEKTSINYIQNKDGTLGYRSIFIPTPPTA